MKFPVAVRVKRIAELVSRLCFHPPARRAASRMVGARQGMRTMPFRVPSAASALPGQHGTDEGHLIGTGEWGKIDLVGKLEVTQTPDLVADVTAFGNYAYLANWGEPDCAGPEKGGSTPPTLAPG